MPVYSLLLHPLPGTHLFQGDPARLQAGYFKAQRLIIIVRLLFCLFLSPRKESRYVFIAVRQHWDVFSLATVVIVALPFVTGKPCLCYSK